MRQTYSSIYSMSYLVSKFCLQELQSEVARLTQELAARDAAAAEQQQHCLSDARQLAAGEFADAERRAAAAAGEADSLRQTVTQREAQLETLEARLLGTEAALQAVQVGGRAQEKNLSQPVVCIAQSLGLTGQRACICKAI